MLENTYTLSTETVGGITRYFVTFFDGQGIIQMTEVSYPVYLEFLRFVKTERNLKRWTERHIEQSSLTCETLYKRAFKQPKCVEDVVVDKLKKELLQQVIDNLPETQRRRFSLYYEFDLTYEQIAEIEGRHFTSIRESVRKAEETIKNIMKNF